MLNSVYRVMFHINLSVIRVISPTRNKLRYLQFNPFSSITANPISETVNQDSFTVNYLINTFGFSREKAFTASKYLKVCSKEKPDLVIALFKNHGLTEEQIGCIVRNFPPIIHCDPKKTLLPKIEFFRSLGISDAEMTKIFLSAPGIFRTSLEKQIMPSFKYIKSLFDSNGTSLASMNRLAQILGCDLESRLLPNIEILRNAGVPDSKIVFLLQYQPRTVMVDTEKFRKVVEEVKQMRFDPSELKFTLAIQTIRAMSKPTWEKKVAVYKKWGWSENDIILAFQRNPYCMAKSTYKITAFMDFIVNKMEFDSSLVVKRSEILSYSLEKRIKPRFLVYKYLLEKGLIEKGSKIDSTIKFTEMKFLKTFVQRYETEVPGLLQLYQKELAASKS